MPQALAKPYLNIDFSTENREDFIDVKIKNELLSYIATICKNFENNAFQIGETDNNIHILCNLSRKIALSKLVQEIKAHSSKVWQDGF